MSEQQQPATRQHSGAGRAVRATGRLRVKVRRATLEDVPAIYACQRAAYAGLPESALCSERHLRMQIQAFPEGQFVAETADGRIVGYAMSLIVQLDEDSPWYSYNEITGGGTFSTHNPAGDTLYGADIAVHPDFRGQGVAGKLYQARKRLLARYNLRRMVAGGRIPGYQRYQGQMTAEEYVEKVVRGELKDPALNAHLKAGYRVRGVFYGYLRDEQSLNYATFIEYLNPRYDPARRRIAAAPIRRPVRRVRVCAAQYRLRPVRSWDDLKAQVEFFVNAANVYHCHFLCFPELFTAQFFSALRPELTAREALAELAEMRERYLELFRQQAQRSGMYIVGGSHPVRTETGIRNTAHLFTPSGQVYTQDKLHVTPWEHEHYGIERGHGLKVFDTGLARIAMLVCYDVEFPELARLLTLAGAEILFVPFNTDERKAYMRVRHCAQARAVENAIYVVLSGNVGNLPQVRSFIINYGQAAVLTPCDVAFPAEGVAAIADPNSETVVMSDLDLVALEQQRELGSVRLLRDRRTDLYALVARSPVEVVRTA
ncbi:MAG: hydrolase [Planctomycetota bacterium]|nr:MAG: hydrolase [Planctomycetota bacterium]